jgi:hypothetical protein
MKIGVCMNIDKAKAFIIDLVNKNNEKIIEKRPNMIITEENIYQIISASMSSRGYRFHKVYVDREVDNEFIECVLKPITILASMHGINVGKPVEIVE